MGASCSGSTVVLFWPNHPALQPGTARRIRMGEGDGAGELQRLRFRELFRKNGLKPSVKWPPVAAKH